MGEIKRQHLDKWREVTRSHLLSGPKAPAPTADFSADGRNLDCRHGRDRFLSRVRQQLLHLVRETGRYGEDALRQLERAFYSNVTFIARHPEVPRRILTWSLQNDDARLQRRVQKVITHYERRVLRLIAEGQQQGCIRRDIEPHAASGIFVGMLQNLVLRLLADRSQSEILLKEADRIFPVYLELIRCDGKVLCEPRLNSSAP